jgi:hypothetical protein
MLITNLEFRQVVQAWDGIDGTQAELAAALGMSKGGWHNNVDALVRIGVLTKLTRRGRAGFTHVRARRGLRFVGFAVHVLGRRLNVAYQGIPRREESLTVESLIGDIYSRALRGAGS